MYFFFLKIENIISLKSRRPNIYIYREAYYTSNKTKKNSKLFKSKKIDKENMIVPFLSFLLSYINTKTIDNNKIKK